MHAVSRYIPSALSYQVAMRSVRSWQIVCLVLLVLLTLALVLILVMLPLKETQIRFLRVATGEDVLVEVWPAELPKQQHSLLLAKELVQFVKDAHQVDHITENYRFRRIHKMATLPVYQELVTNYKDVKRALGNKGSRSITIVYDRHRQPGLMEVEFMTYDMVGGKPKQASWEAIIRYQIQPTLAKVTADAAAMNPLGIRINAYHIKKKHQAGESQL